MFSRILVKLVDEAIVPAIVLLSVRIVAVLVVAKFFDISFSFGARGFIYTNRSDFIFVNSYSTASMIVVLAVGLIYVLLKSLIFHESHIPPHTAAKLFSLNLSGFIQTSFDVYSQGAIWLAYSYLLLAASGIMSYFGLLYTWVFYTSIVLTLISTYLLVIDVEREVVSGEDQDNLPKEDTVLTFEEEA
ncbi:hypothetical protein HYV31_02660 [candidate division WWE3 bacterium]|nr:hypothetical protein [candidate division WWE3 bacterium]